MSNLKLISIGFLNSFGVLAYIALVSFALRNGEKIFGQMDSFLAPVAFLLLFVFSALTTSLLVLGRPIYYYLNGKKAEALKLIFFTVLWLFAMLIAVFGSLVMVRLA
ncbi:MAG: hypothetical protein WC745_00895 [Patescibacteria group bacterium]|jgi:hypothetical protein